MLVTEAELLHVADNFISIGFIEDVISTVHIYFTNYFSFDHNDFIKDVISINRIDFVVSAVSINQLDFVMGAVNTNQLDFVMSVVNTIHIDCYEIN